MNNIQPTYKMTKPGDEGDNGVANESDNLHFNNILEQRLSRREVLGGSLSAAVASMFGISALASFTEQSLAQASLGQPLSPSPKSITLNFTAVPPSRSDTVILPTGCKAQVLLPWGTPITGNYPAYNATQGNSGAEQEQQIGSNHDGMHYFPFDDAPNAHGLLCINHEYVDEKIFHPKGPSFILGQRPADEVRKEIAGHGVSVVEIKKNSMSGEWELVKGQYNRRITAGTRMEFRGPVRGNDLVKTRYSTDGTHTRGTINNCANGYTPWGTYLTCEENWSQSFINRTPKAKIDALFDWAETSFPELFPNRATSFEVDGYYARYYPATKTHLGVKDATIDQKTVANIYVRGGSFGNNIVLIGKLDDYLEKAGIAKDLSREQPREQKRYTVSTTASRYGWETAQNAADEYIRFDVSIKAASATQDYRNEANGQGWVVEIDPFDPNSTPIKRTALGRFNHEGCVFAPVTIGKPLVYYMGDDARNEYIYKFVTKAAYSKSSNGDILDEGTLYVARFNADGSGVWLALDINDSAFQAAATAKKVTFKDQADILVNARTAADVVGATKMDRPEWGAVHPETGDVYMTLTNNTRDAANVDAANPRGPNPYGHIIRWRENQSNAAALQFAWDIYVLAGPANEGQVLPAQGGAKLTQDNMLASPDGLWFDQFGTLWIQTDMSGAQQNTGPFGENAMFAANPVTGEMKRFMTGPKNQETTGITSTPDGKTLFVNFQHPGDLSEPGKFTSNWPDHGKVYGHPGDATVTPDSNGPRPRSATVVITRTDGSQLKW